MHKGLERMWILSLVYFMLVPDQRKERLRNPQEKSENRFSVHNRTRDNSVINYPTV